MGTISPFLASHLQAGEDGTLFGSITKSDVVALIKDQLDLSVETQDIEMGDIRNTGSHEVSVKLHPEVIAKVRLLTHPDPSWGYR